MTAHPTATARAPQEGSLAGAPWERRCWCSCSPGPSGQGSQTATAHKRVSAAAPRMPMLLCQHTLEPHPSADLLALRGKPPTHHRREDARPQSVLRTEEPSPGPRTGLPDWPALLPEPVGDGVAEPELPEPVGEGEGEPDPRFPEPVGVGVGEPLWPEPVGVGVGEPEREPLGVGVGDCALARRQAQHLETAACTTKQRCLCHL